MPDGTCRELTKKLRTAGSMLGKIVIHGQDETSLEFVDPNQVCPVDREWRMSSGSSGS
jgi:carbamoylphosphate synthase small subunit